MEGPSRAGQGKLSVETVVALFHLGSPARGKAAVPDDIPPSPSLWSLRVCCRQGTPDCSCRICYRSTPRAKTWMSPWWISAVMVPLRSSSPSRFQ